MGVDHALRPPGRATRVHVVGRGVGRNDGLHRRVRHTCEQGIEGGAAVGFRRQGQERDASGIVLPQGVAPVLALRLEEGAPDLVEIEQVDHFFRREPPVELDHGAAQLQDRNFRDHDLRAVARDDGDAVARRNAETAQAVRRPVDECLQLPVGDAPVAEYNGLTLRAACKALVEDLTDAGRFLKSADVIHIWLAPIQNHSNAPTAC